MHHVTVDLLRSSYKSLKRDAASGVDAVTWQKYGEQLEESLVTLWGTEFCAGFSLFTFLGI
jgi:hypothetical protein